ncbi:hypothetical protein VSDG_02030 [Cytospora chrysosperma]|uniref:Complex III subunit 9 n=1 Tax=Cytospora chrysosperma TaxID=252740 RepID=A0A423WE19_CYTCH|nr:hypothetical protein VSDG_02030 [Valsa sordida]
MAGHPTLYNIFFRNNFVMLGAVFASAFAFQMSFDVTTTKMWDNMNRGRQWKDIKANIEEVGMNGNVKTTN